MAIYNIFDYYDKETVLPGKERELPSVDPSAFFSHRGDQNYIEDQKEKGKLFSTIAARFFFFLLLIADIVWSIYSTFALVCKFHLALLTLFKVKLLRQSLAHTYLSFKRSLVCAIALFVALFAPALGIMFSCMYFLMYDKSGIDEIVPSSLREQFKELFPV